MKYKSEFKEYFKKIITFRDYTIFDTEHSVARFKERISNDMFLYEKLLKKGINYIIDNGLERISDRYMWYSSKYKFAIQVEWRMDREGRKFGGYSATCLSEKEMSFFTKKDKKILLENIQKYESAKRSKDIFKHGYFNFEYPTKEFQEEMDRVHYNMFVQEDIIYYDFTLVNL